MSFVQVSILQMMLLPPRYFSLRPIACRLTTAAKARCPKMITVDDCIICGSGVVKWPGQIAPFIADYVFDGRLTKYDLCYCPRCQMIFSDVRFDDAEVSRLYSNYRGEDYCRIREAHEPGYRRINDKFGNDAHGNLVRKRFIERVLSKRDTATVGSVLDYGGDRGQLIPDGLAAAERYVYDVSGVPPIEGVHSITTAEDAAPYDLVMCCQVLEHVSDPAGFLETLKTLLRDNGLLYVEVPAGIPTRRYFDVTMGRRWLDRLWHPRMHEHINYFTKASLRNALLLHGLTPLDTEIVILDLGWCIAPVIGCLATCSERREEVRYGTIDMLLEGLEYGCRRHLLPYFKET